MNLVLKELFGRLCRPGMPPTHYPAIQKRHIRRVSQSATTISSGTESQTRGQTGTTQFITTCMLFASIVLIVWYLFDWSSSVLAQHGHGFGSESLGAHEGTIIIRRHEAAASISCTDRTGLIMQCAFRAIDDVIIAAAKAAVVHASIRVPTVM